jgi:SAM-dependent methyltransferase
MNQRAVITREKSCPEQRQQEISVVEKPSTESAATGRQRLALRLRFFYLGRRLSSRVERMLSAVYAGFWLGCFDDHDIGAVVARLYEQNDLYRTAAHNLQGLFEWETRLLHEYFSECRSIVVAAAGGGREVIGLVRAGWLADGFECNPELVEKAREFLDQAGLAGRIFLARPDEVPGDLRSYDGAIVGCGALGHIHGRVKRVKFLKDLKSLLRPGAPVLLSVGRRPEGSRYHRWIYQIARAIRLVSRSKNSPELGDDPLDLYTHRFTETEIHAELQAATFEIVKSTEALEIYVVAHA